MYFSGNGGPNCAKFSSPQRQVLEFIAGTTLALISLLVGISLHSYPSPIHLPFTKVSTLKLKITYLLLVSMSVTYLAEAGYKIYTYQAIFIANPCHCLCLVQIFILYRAMPDRPPIPCLNASWACVVLERARVFPFYLSFLFSRWRFYKNTESFLLF